MVQNGTETAKWYRKWYRNLNITPYPGTQSFKPNLLISSRVENVQVNLGDLIHLVATRDLLDRAGFRPVDRHEIVKEKSVEELNAQLVSLVGENGAEILISAFKSRRSISGPELA